MRRATLGASSLVTFLRVKLPIVLPSVLAVFALNFNALFTEYDMSRDVPIQLRQDAMP